LGGGLLLGVPLALVGLRFTRFETTPEGRFYTSHPYIGITIAAVLVVRMFYRLTELFGSRSQFQRPPVMMQSALTLSLFGLLAGYYIAYNAGVLISSRKV
jgi:cytochrome b561